MKIDAYRRRLLNEIDSLYRIWEADTCKENYLRLTNAIQAYEDFASGLTVADIAEEISEEQSA